MDTITTSVTNRTALVNVTNAPNLTGRDTRGRDRIITITPVRIQFREGFGDYAEPGDTSRPRRTAMVTGPFRRDFDGGGSALSGFYRTIEVDLTQPTAPDWLLGLATISLPEGDLREYRP